MTFFVISAAPLACLLTRRATVSATDPNKGSVIRLGVLLSGARKMLLPNKAAPPAPETHLFKDRPVNLCLCISAARADTTCELLFPGEGSGTKPLLIAGGSRLGTWYPFPVMKRRERISPRDSGGFGLVKAEFSLPRRGASE